MTFEWSGKEILSSVPGQVHGPEWVDPDPLSLKLMDMHNNSE